MSALATRNTAESTAAAGGLGAHAAGAADDEWAGIVTVLVERPLRRRPGRKELTLRVSKNREQ